MALLVPHWGQLLGLLLQQVMLGSGSQALATLAVLL
jgi:hypothetical protein